MNRISCRFRLRLTIRRIGRLVIYYPHAIGLNRSVYDRLEPTPSKLHHHAPRDAPRPCSPADRTILSIPLFSPTSHLLPSPSGVTSAKLKFAHQCPVNRQDISDCVLSKYTSVVAGAHQLMIFRGADRRVCCGVLLRCADHRAQPVLRLLLSSLATASAITGSGPLTSAAATPRAITRTGRSG